jgi:hypothetical protein
MDSFRRHTMPAFAFLALAAMAPAPGLAQDN